MGKPLELPKEAIAILEKERNEVQLRLTGIKLQLSALRRAAMDAAGWVKCCRCYPSWVGDDDGFCGCCLYNQITGVTLSMNIEEEE